MKTNTLTISTFKTELGHMGVAVDSRGKLVRVWFDYSSEMELRAAIKNWIDELGDGSECIDFNDRANPKLVRRFKDFAKGKTDTFADLAIDSSEMTPFQRRVIREARRIAYGRTLSYGELALKAGSPRAARAVGSVMAHNRFPLVVPCHRVVAGGRRLGGFSSVRGCATKRRLLRLEGSINEKGALVG